ncbi:MULTISPECIES: cytochrome c oxidase assembly protein [unclassified Ruegeria]|uniref:cytochrome c oxidase assembly protein n=1 Tax=unclassified Ruegeria TaxID=2625375 RepID=UPI001ADB6718|nr:MULTISPECIES: cytochrome c oxidase assembly protein [unclassified Ruegeria]MBO9410061.1 cytochrome c oxidase assembly protein [Ruegeria sp. R8_1]MBO9414720.1 cytochrome c oxidase assembly protein [Ruegeria sp. R8_2]
MALSGPQKTVAQTVGVVVLMGSLAWAAVPFYDWFCRVTGFGGTTGVAETAPEDILDRTVTVRFDASKAKDMAWEFKPVEREMEVRIGETGLAFYEAFNPTDRPIAGQASYNVAPYSAGGYFQKIACFCFEEQVLQPGERIQMPVSFFVDPEMVEDLEAKYVHTITLSYTFYEIDLPEGYAALDAQADTNTN